MADHCPAMGISSEQYSSHSRNLEIKRVNAEGVCRNGSELIGKLAIY
jgi:hypothetical protein